MGAVPAMFEEDPQWNSGIPNAFADELHYKLFGEIRQDDGQAAQLEAGQSKEKKKRKRKRDLKVNETTIVGGTNSEKEEYGDSRGSTRKTSKIPKSDRIIVEQKDTTLNQSQKRRKSESHQELCPVNTHHHPQEEGSSAIPWKKNKSSSKLFSKMSSQLEGSRFRMINQQLYTSSGAEAKALFESDPDLFDVYHRGFSMQVSKWPSNPLDRIIARVKSLPQNLVISDFGCGEAKLAQSVPHRVHSFDLVAISDRVVACDMAHVPLEKHTVDVCIFCLSLMGSNVSEFIREARRVVKKGGEMIICEVLSRFSSVDDFIRDVEAFGFKLLTKTEISKMFIELLFRAVSRDSHRDLPQITLKPCIYKRR